jgi:hypothetical protein
MRIMFPQQGGISPADGLRRSRLSHVAGRPSGACCGLASGRLRRDSNLVRLEHSCRRHLYALGLGPAPLIGRPTLSPCQLLPPLSRL